ncbi:MAG: hypothetical protein NXH85_03770 [Pseudomonadaceae bacterium]|nr:hypothetical protein [Pseudomonadaceae bacterium]
MIDEADSRDTVVFDLDGTLALIDHRRYLVRGKKKRWRDFFAACVDDEPNTPVIALARMLRQQSSPKLRLIVFSGRSDEVRSQTLAWLDKHVGTDVFDEIRMRREGDYTPDDDLKRAWAEPIKEKILFSVDDRNKVVRMWRELGITCFQVADGDF